MTGGADDARRLLRKLRERGVEVEADGDALRLRGPRERLQGEEEGLLEEARDAKPVLLRVLRRERVERLLDLVPVDPETALPDLPVDESATERQAERLRELAEDPAFGEHRKRVRKIVERALDRGLSQLGAYGLLGELGRRIADRREAPWERERPPKTCSGCGRPIGPTSERCATCKTDEAEEETP